MYNLKKQGLVMGYFWRLSEGNGEVANGYKSFFSGVTVSWKNPKKKLSDEEVIAEVIRLW